MMPSSVRSTLLALLGATLLPLLPATSSHAQERSLTLGVSRHFGGHPRGYGGGLSLTYGHALPSGWLLRPTVAYARLRNQSVLHVRNAEEVTDLYTARLDVGGVLASWGALQLVPEAGLGYGWVRNDVIGGGSFGDRYDDRYSNGLVHLGLGAHYRVSSVVRVGLTLDATLSLPQWVLPFTDDLASFDGNSAGVTVTYDL